MGRKGRQGRKPDEPRAVAVTRQFTGAAAGSVLYEAGRTRVLCTASVEKGVYVEPELNDYALHNEYDDDGDGDGTDETHVRRYINSKGDTAFSMTTSDQLWAWSVDSKAGDDADINKNHVIRDSNCDGIFDQRYSLNAKFHVPSCLLQAGAADKPES